VPDPPDRAIKQIIDYFNLDLVGCHFADNIDILLTRGGAVQKFPLVAKIAMLKHCLSDMDTLYGEQIQAVDFLVKNIGKSRLNGIIKPESLAKELEYFVLLWLMFLKIFRSSI